jgi:collagen type III alpha
MVIDANQDGELSKEEIEGAAKALRTLDKNGDGKLTREELFPGGMGPGGFLARPGETPPGGGQPGTPPVGKRRGGLPGNLEANEFRERLKRADANGDGKLSKEEAPERIKDNFDRLDANGDGFLDEAEMRQMMQRMLGGGPGKRPEGKRPKANDQ